jgi:hypothetical protein
MVILLKSPLRVQEEHKIIVLSLKAGNERMGISNNAKRQKKQ